MSTVRQFIKDNLWLIPLFLFSIISLLGDVINDKFDLVDFEVYFRTAARMLEGAEIYRIESDGHFVYKYAPTAALYFLPFVILGFGLAKYIFWIFVTVALAWGLHTLISLLRTEESSRQVNFIIIGSILAVVPHIHLEWHLGQVNLLLMVLYVALINYSKKNQQQWLGIFLGASLFVKPFGLVFLPYLVVKKQFKALFYTAGALFALGLLPLLFYPSWSALVGLYNSWMVELQIELAAKQDLVADANHTIFSVLARYTPIQYFIIHPMTQKLYQLTILGLIGLSFLVYMAWGKKMPQAFVGELALLSAWIPLLAFTSQNAFIYTVPLIVVVLFQYKQLPLWGKVLAVLGCFLLGINMYDIVGKTMHWTLLQASIYTFGSMALIIVAFYQRKQQANSN